MLMMKRETHVGRIHGFREIGIFDRPRIEENLLLQEITHRINDELVSTIGFIALNGNAYEEGLKKFWDPIRAYWADGVTRSLALDAHGKSLSSALLDLDIAPAPDHK